MTGDLAEAAQMEPAATDALMAAFRRGIPMEPLNAGQRLALAPGLSMEVLHPKPQSAAKDANDLSLMLMFDIGGVRLLTAGDLTANAEPLHNVDCDILKVAHHGSKTSTSPAFLRAAAPALALISVGRNNFGHPSQTVLDNLSEAGARVLRTDYGGTLTIRFPLENQRDQRKVSIHTFLPYEENET
jgi:competence protein ComEC